jgi:uncharacterized protein (DUF924 family)
MGWHQAVLDFWFGLDPARHWRVDPVLDEEIRARFGKLLETEAAYVTPAKAGALGRNGAHSSLDPRFRRDDEVERFVVSPDHALAAVILFDQLPRNMFRGDRRAFATDKLARRIAGSAIDRGLDTRLPVERRLFLYLPFEHSEDLADQDRSVRLIGALGRADWADFAVKHRDVIARFGRFPHRNRVLGRESTVEEKAFGLEPAW